MGRVLRGKGVSMCGPDSQVLSGKGQGEGIGDLGDLVLEELWPISVPRTTW